MNPEDRQAAPSEILARDDEQNPTLDRPRRIQLSRRKGWRKPENTVVVARPSKWGNPWKVGEHCLVEYPYRLDHGEVTVREFVVTPALAVELFRQAVALDAPEIRAELAGKNLACWCPLDQPCHADVLLEIANGETDERRALPPHPRPPGDRDALPGRVGRLPLLPDRDRVTAPMNDDEKRAELRGRRYLKPSEAAVLIRRDKRTINRWIKNGLAVINLGKHRFVETKELLRWAADEDRRTRRRESASK